MSRKVKALIFDMDGLMIDTETIIYKLYKQVFKEHGYELTLDIFKESIGLRTVDTSAVYKAHYDDKFDYIKLRDYAQGRFWKYFADAGDAVIKKGLFELLDYAKANELKLAVATSTRRETAAEILEKIGVYKYFDVFVYGDIIENGKPAPDIYIKASEMLDIPCEYCIGLEDSFNGIKSVYLAGMIPVMVPDMLEPTEEIKKILFNRVDSLLDVIPLLEEINA
ncbi:MAG: HAD family phosphatase [Bacillota bacterium]|nr:HAD family phosphatase [Bacillota bacterium]